MLIFVVFLPLKGPLVAAFSEALTLTFRKYINELGINIPKVSQNHKLLRLHLFVFALK